MFRRAVIAASAAVLVPALAVADDAKRCVDAEFTPVDGLQLVVWLETASGEYVDTLFITQQTGSFGLGNRPGRYDFNSGPLWPYGRRINTFPVWSHRNGQHFPSVVFQNLADINGVPVQDPGYCSALSTGAQNYASCGENDLSHPAGDSSPENHYCHPLLPTDPAWDAMTCPSASFTDKGRFSTDPTFDTGYPPRTDLIAAANDSSAVAMFQAMNPFDAVSAPTPVGGAAAHAPWAAPDDLPDGDYVLFVEAAQESDFNATYSQIAFPAPPDIAWGGYGVPYRGQPSVIYSVPITISQMAMTAETMQFAGYGDPTGADGVIRPPDGTITTDTPGTGASRLQLVADGADLYRVRVTNEPDTASQLPAMPAQVQATAVTSSDATLSFIAPSVGASADTVTGYDIRIRANDAMTADNFADSTPLTSKIVPVAPGHTQTIDVPGLLPDTDYWIGVSAFNGCHDDGPIAIVKVTTVDRTSGAVDACFVATAAYGSMMANDVELLRHFRDTWLETNVVGELGVEAYYTFGPAVAGIVGESDLLRTTARDALAPVVRAVRRLKR